MSKVSQRQIVAKVEIAKGNLNRTPSAAELRYEWSSNERPYFAQVSGGDVTATTERVYDGGTTFPDVLPSPVEVGDLQLTRPFDPEIDGPLLKHYRSRVGKARFDVTVFTLNDDLVVHGSERIYPNALLVGIADPEGDASSGAGANFTLTFACQSVTEGSLNR